MISLCKVRGNVFVIVLALALGLLLTGDLNAREAELEDAEIRIETNSSDGDSGLQIFADGEPWQGLRVKGPDGRIVYVARNRGILRSLGSTEFFTESNEPNYQDISFPTILGFMPEGEYKFEGLTINGFIITGEAELTHDLPCGPELIFPMEDDVVDPEDPLIISWMPVTNKIDTDSPDGECGDETDIEIIRYELILEIVDSEPEQKLTVIVPGDASEYMVSPDFVLPGAEYQFEVIAREESGNQTITEGGFFTSN